jgi:hypothetical protein
MSCPHEPSGGVDEANPGLNAKDATDAKEEQGRCDMSRFSLASLAYVAVKKEVVSIGV